MKEQDLLHPTLPGYVVESSSCLDNLAREACVFLLGKSVYASISYHSKENCLQICGIQLQTKASNLIILSLHRVASRDLNQFIKSLYVTWEYLNYSESGFKICGTINTDYPSENYWRKLLTSLLTHNLSGTVKFATRIQNDSIIAFVNMFVDNVRLNPSLTSPILNGPSHHDA
jgi:hypothetical protein